MEFWDVYDINRNKTNRKALRGENLKSDDFHLVVHACIFNSNGDMLIQQRQSFKEGWANMWDLTVGGSALVEETSQLAVQRELYEELGIDMDFHKIRPHLTINFEKGFDDVYLIEKEINLDTLNLQFDEVQNVRWESKEKILTMIKNSNFIPYHESLINLLFDIRKQYGAIKIK